MSRVGNIGSSTIGSCAAAGTIDAKAQKANKITLIFFMVQMFFRMQKYDFSLIKED